MLKKGSKLSLVFILALSGVLTACSNGGQSDNGSSANGANTGNSNRAESTVLDNPANFKFDPPVTIRTANTFAENQNDFKSGESFEDNMHTRWMRETMGIDVQFDFVVPKWEDYKTKIRLLLAGKKRLPDVINTQTDLAIDLINANAVMPLNEHMDKYLSPEMKALYDKYPQAFAPVTRDGKIYGLPEFFAMDEGPVMWVRADWLENLGMKAPTTLDEFSELLRAFTEDDPDRNGANDTVGLAISLIDGPYNWMATGDPIAGMFSDHIPVGYNMQEFWTENENGELEFGTIAPEQKTFLQQMHDWMKAGYIDPEAGIKDPAKAGEMAASGKAGIIFGPYWMAGWPLKDAGGFKAFPIPAGPDGNVGRGEKALVANYKMLNKDFEHPEAYFAYWGKIYATNFGESDPYFDESIAKGWHEGYDYVIHDGQVVGGKYEERGVPEEKWPKPGDPTVGYSVKWPITNTPFVPYLIDASLEKFNNDPNAEINNWTDGQVASQNAEQLDAAMVRISQNEQAVFNLFTGAPTKTMLAKQEMLLKLMKESYLKIIYGDEPIEYFDEFVDQWKKSGGEDIIKEVNEWYASSKK
ncbi:extracellular solute-binding protein [Paenibacillus arenilitoris]|uniref:Extracellular solute-binding protein n=1 Tax=Paenibacillus arenilitoris TaxID=2772299 RepID=A0A927CRW7_9BACL|nr:extracellular solute-binding protein [Paenibacillus arenilitoris]MBD2872487.1 extracellular solute-binding protein [Paenibacillus arenilitoris]